MSGLGEKEERTMGEGEKNARGTGGNLLLCCVPFFSSFQYSSRLSSAFFLPSVRSFFKVECRRLLVFGLLRSDLAAGMRN